LQWVPDVPANPVWTTGAPSWIVPPSKPDAQARPVDWKAEFEAACRADEAERALAEDVPSDPELAARLVHEKDYYGPCGTLELLGTNTITCAGALTMGSGSCIDLSGRGLLSLDESTVDLTGEFVQRE
jgi:hypothetical protein